MNYYVISQSFFAKVEIVRILLFHFLVDLLPKIVQSQEKVSFSTHTQKTFYVLDLERRKSKTPPAGQVCKSQNQNQKTYAHMKRYFHIVSLHFHTAR
jgi:hypothetical protein